MESASYQQRSNIRKARQRDPIVSVFLHNNQTRCYSITVPPSKSWNEFIIKIRNQFQIPADSTLALYRSQSQSLNEEQNEIDLNNLDQYDTNSTNMNKIKHKHVFCVKIINTNDDNKLNHIKSKRNKKKSKKYRHNTTSDTDSTSNESSASSTDSQEQQEHKTSHITDVNERSFGLDLDIFDRLCTSKKAAKRNSKPQYHYHPTSAIQSLDFHLKETWLNLKTQPLCVKHMDDKYSIMCDKNKQFNLRTRRIIWPRNLQFMTHEFEYNLRDITSKWIWAIIIVHGGKFAGAIYHGNKLVLHKTLRRYVVRKKQGKRQINHMSSSGVKSGSAGGYKRAWNEKKLLQEIREILCKWMDELAIHCDKIFVHSPGIYNKTTLYGNNEEQRYLYPQHNGALNEALSKERHTEIKHKNKNLYRLYKKDERIIQIPITTHGVTLKEVERVHYWLSTCWLSRNQAESQ